MAMSETGSLVKEARELRLRSAAARAQARALVTSARQLRAQLEQAITPPPSPELLRHSLHARLLARLETMPVIEQAKGVIMAQSHCESAEAFDLLRRASQRSNVPVRELAAALVNRQTSSNQAPGPATTAAIPAPRLESLPRARATHPPRAHRPARR